MATHQKPLAIISKILKLRSDFLSLKTMLSETETTEAEAIKPKLKKPTYRKAKQSNIHALLKKIALAQLKHDTNYTSVAFKKCVLHYFFVPKLKINDKDFISIFFHNLLYLIPIPSSNFFDRLRASLKPP